MTVKELKKALETIPDEARVCLEVWMNPEAEVVKSYEIDGEKLCYIADDIEELEYNLLKGE